MYTFITNKYISFYIHIGRIRPFATVFAAERTMARHSLRRKSAITLRLYAVTVRCAPLPLQIWTVQGCRSLIRFRGHCEEDPGQ